MKEKPKLKKKKNLINYFYYIIFIVVIIAEIFLLIYITNKLDENKIILNTKVKKIMNNKNYYVNNNIKEINKIQYYIYLKS